MVLGSDVMSHFHTHDKQSGFQSVQINAIKT